MKLLIANLRKLLANKTAQTMIYFIALALLPYLLPQLSRYRVLVPTKLLALLTLNNNQFIQSGKLARVPEFDEVKRVAKVGKIEDASGHALDQFFAALQKVEQAATNKANKANDTHDAHVSICHYGDSQIINDNITSTLRRRLQSRFGDAGHGFMLAAKPWSWYEHKDVFHQASTNWQNDPMVLGVEGDHRYGLGGARFISREAGATVSFATNESNEKPVAGTPNNQSTIGRQVSSFDIYFLAHPGGGDFDIEVDGTHYERVSTADNKIHSSFYLVKVKNGKHKITLTTVGNGEVELFGMVMESALPGITYDSLGINAASIGMLDKFLDAENWREQLQHRRPQLIVIAYGVNEGLAYLDLTNEIELKRKFLQQYENETKAVISRIRNILPDCSIMLIGPLDRGTGGEAGAINTRPMVPILTSYQRRIAAETGCAFFDAYSAMGGEGTAAKWYEARPRLMGGDFVHPTETGADIIGSLIYDAFIDSYENYKKKF